MPPVIYKDHRGNRLPSVTTIIGRFKESGGLLYWANQQGLEGKTLDQARAEVTTPGTLAHKAVEDHIPTPEIKRKRPVINRKGPSPDPVSSFKNCEGDFRRGICASKAKYTDRPHPVKF